MTISVLANRSLNSCSGVTARGETLRGVNALGEVTLVFPSGTGLVVHCLWSGKARLPRLAPQPVPALYGLLNQADRCFQGFAVVGSTTFL